MTDWTAVGAIATGGAAIFTAAAACVTALMARATRDVARSTGDAALASLREAQAVERQLEVSAQPWLNWVGGEDGQFVAPVSIHESDMAVAGTIRVRNVGNGLALILTSGRGLGVRDNLELQPYTRLTTATPVVPTGQLADLRFSVPRPIGVYDANALTGRGTRGHGQFGFDVAYSDSAGATTYRARFKVGGTDETGNNWKVYEIEYFRGDDPNPVAVVQAE